MTNPAFLLCNGNLTFDPSMPNLCTDKPNICYGTKVSGPRSSGSGGGDWGYAIKVPSDWFDDEWIRPRRRRRGHLSPVESLVKRIRHTTKKASDLLTVGKVTEVDSSDDHIRFLEKRIREFQSELTALRQKRLVVERAEAELVKLTLVIEKLRANVAHLQKHVRTLQETVVSLNRKINVRAVVLDAAFTVTSFIVARSVKNKTFKTLSYIAASAFFVSGSVRLYKAFRDWRKKQ